MRYIYLILILLSITDVIYSQQSINDKFEKGLYLYQNNNFYEAYTVFNSIKSSEIKDPHKAALAYYYVGEINFQMERYYEATLDLERYLQLQPIDINVDKALYRLGLIYYKLFHYDKSLEYFNKLLKYDNNSELKYLAEYWIGEGYLKQDNYNKAEVHFLKSLEDRNKNKEYDLALYSLGYLSEKKGAYSKAEVYYERLLFEDSESSLISKTLARLGYTYYILGKYQRAINRLTNKVVGELPDSVLTESNYILANAYYNTGKYQESVNLFKQIADRYKALPIYRSSKYGLAWSYYQLGDYEKAYANISELKEGDDSLAERSLYWMAYFSRYLDNNDRAIKEFKEYLDRYPIYRLADDAKYQIGLIYYLDRRFKEAEKYLFMAYDVSSETIVRANSSQILGMIELSRRNFPKAKRYFEAAVSGHNEEDKEFPTALLSLGIVNFYLNNLETARSIFANLIPRSNLTEPEKAHFYYAETQFSLKNFTMASSNYEAAIKYSKNDSITQLAEFGLIYSNYNLKNFNYVVSLIQDYLKKYKNDKRNTELKLRLADCYYGLKQYALAGEIYKEFFSQISSGKASDYAAYQYAQALYKSGNVRAAREEYARFPDRFPSSRFVDETQYILAWIYFQSRDYSSAINQYKTVLSEYPESNLKPLIYYGLGDCYFNNGDYENALTYYNRILTEYKNSSYVVDAINGIQYCYLVQGKVAEAAQVISDFVNNNPGLKNLDKLLIKKGDVYASQRDFGSSVTAYKEFVSVFPQSTLVPLAYYSMSKSYLQMNNFPEAIKSLNIIISDYSGSEIFFDAIMDCGNIYREQNDFNTALTYFDRIINSRSEKHKGEAYFWKGKCNQGLNQNQAAANLYNYVIVQYPKSTFYSRSMYEIGIIAFNNKDYQNAIDYFSKVVELRSDEFGAESQLLIGKIYFNQNNYNDAIAELLKLKSTFPGFTEILMEGLILVGESYEKLNENVRAIDYYNEAISLDTGTDITKDLKKRIGRLK